MKNQNIKTHNGVSYHHVGRGKWQFDATTKQGLSYTRLDTVHGAENARRVAGIIGGAMKRTKAGQVTLDALAQANIEHFVYPAKSENEKAIARHAYNFPQNPRRLNIN